MKKTVLMSVLMTLCLSSCSDSDDAEIVLNGGYHPLNYMNYIQESDFIGYVRNNIFRFQSYGLSNDEPVAYTRLSPPPTIYEDDLKGEWLKYCPISFWFDDDLMYCTPQMDFTTYQQWHEFSETHEVEVFVRSGYKYNPENGILTTVNEILPAEKWGISYQMGLSKYGSNELLGLDIKLNEPLFSDINNEAKYYRIYMFYERVSRNYPFDTELKVFDTNKEAVAYAKELMGI